MYVSCTLNVMLLTLFRLIAAAVKFLDIHCYSKRMMFMDASLVCRVDRWLQQTSYGHLTKPG